MFSIEVLRVGRPPWNVPGGGHLSDSSKLDERHGLQTRNRASFRGLERQGGPPRAGP